MAAETLVLDPTEIDSTRSALDITPWLSQDGVDWGDAEIQAFMSEATRGEVPVDFRVPNRQISAPLIFKATVGGTTTVAARAAIQAKLALFQRDGGSLRRVTAGGGTVYAQVVNATFRATSIPGYQSRDNIDTDASFSLECLPEFFEAETTDADNSTTNQRELLFTTALTAQGDQPMPVRMVVDNDGSTDWRGLIWCFRAKNYPGSTAATRDTGSASMVYQAESLGTLDTATKVAGTSIYGTATNGQWSGGTIVHHGTLSTSWTPVLSGRIGGTTYPTHTGTYDIWGRLASTSGTTVQARTVWDVGDLVNPTENPAVRMPGANSPYILRLGEVRIDNPGIGTHRWDWQIQAKGDAGAETFSVDKVWIANKDEGMGVLSVPTNIPEGLVAYSARSEFTTESGVITGDSLAVGGVWTVITNSDTTDFSESGDICTRTATSDTGTAGGRIGLGRGVYASTPTTLTNTAAKLDFKVSSADSGVHLGLLLRVDNAANDMLVIDVQPSGLVSIHKVVAGTSTQLTFVSLGAALSLDVYYTLKALVTSNGLVLVYFGLDGDAPPLVLSAFDSALATGGTLASGTVGIWDLQGSAGAVTRTYDSFAAWVPSVDAVAFAGQSAQLTTDGIYREDAGGTAYGPVSKQDSSIPRLPVPAISGGTVETLLVPSLGDFATLTDTMGTASISAQNVRRPSWLFVDDT